MSKGFIGNKEDTFETAINTLGEHLDKFVKYLEATDGRSWLLHRVRSKNNKKNCLYGHLVNWYYGKDYEGSVSNIWDAFEEVGTSFYVYPINDGTNPKYPQKTAKERCIAYLNNVISGEELWSDAAIRKEMAELQAKE